MPRPLKVFRTPIGFHDAYVAAPTKKAALAAWGSAANLFARGVAEEVTDPKLTKAPLAAPGAVVKVARGTAAEHVAALGKVARPVSKRGANIHPTPNPAAGRSRPRRDLNDARHRSPAAPEGERRKKVTPQPKPKPSRAKLDAAEVALGAAETAQAAERDELARRERALAAERRALEKAQAAERTKLEKAREAAERAYAAALARWRG